jgi:hypothetical protein
VHENVAATDAANGEVAHESGDRDDCRPGGIGKRDDDLAVLAQRSGCTGELKADKRDDEPECAIGLHLCVSPT